MRFGIVADLKQIEAVASWGFDYIEGTVSSLAKMEDRDFDSLLALVKKAPIKPQAFCVLLDGSFKVVGPEANLKAMEVYLYKTMPRVAALGGKVVVFGSGGPRKAPEGFSLETARNQFSKALCLAGDVALNHGLLIALEPLNRQETNVLNTVAEGAQMVKDLNHKGVKLLADYYHMGREGEATAVVTGLGQILAHAHLAAPSDRRPPALGDGRDWVDFISCLKKGGYEGRLSLEANWEKMEEQAPVALSIMRQVLANMGPLGRVA